MTFPTDPDPYLLNGIDPSKEYYMITTVTLNNSAEYGKIVIPTKGMTPDEINDLKLFVYLCGDSWLKRHGKEHNYTFKPLPNSH